MKIRPYQDAIPGRKRPRNDYRPIGIEHVEGGQQQKGRNKPARKQHREHDEPVEQSAPEKIAFGKRICRQRRTKHPDRGAEHGDDDRVIKRRINFRSPAENHPVSLPREALRKKGIALVVIGFGGRHAHHENEHVRQDEADAQQRQQNIIDDGINFFSLALFSHGAPPYMMPSCPAFFATQFAPTTRSRETTLCTRLAAVPSA